MSWYFQFSLVESLNTIKPTNLSNSVLIRLFYWMVLLNKKLWFFLSSTKYAGSIPGPFSHSWIISGFVNLVTRRVSLVEQELPTLPKHLSSPPIYNIARPLVFCVVFCSSLLACPFSSGNYVVCTFSSGHCVVCPFSSGNYVVCPFSSGHYIVCPFSSGNYVVCPSSNYGLWFFKLFEYNSHRYWWNFCVLNNCIDWKEKKA